MKVNVSEYEAQVIAAMNAALAGQGGASSMTSTLTDGRRSYDASQDRWVSPEVTAAMLVKQMVQPLFDDDQFDAIERIQAAVDAAGIGCICQL